MKKMRFYVTVNVNMNSMIENKILYILIVVMEKFNYWKLVMMVTKIFGMDVAANAT